MKKLATLILAVMLTGCSNKGGEFEGRWLDTGRGTSMLHIQRNDNDYLIRISNPKSRRDTSPGAPVPAVLKDGKLVMEKSMGAPTLTYVKANDSLVFASVLGSEEYRRAKD